MSFDLTADSNQVFNYQIGSVTTSIPWSRPSFEKIKSFFEDDSILHLLEKYNVHLTGGCMWNFNTWDIDLILIHDWDEFTDWNAIEQDLNILNDTALNKHKILIDLTVFNKIDHSFRFPTKSQLIECNKGKNESEYVCERGLNEISVFVKIGYIKKQVGDEIEETCLDLNEMKKLLTENYLCEIDVRNTPHSYKIVQKILTFDESSKFIHHLGYKEFIAMDSEAFFNIQNKRTLSFFRQ